MPLALLLCLVAASEQALMFEAEADLVLSPRSGGSGVTPDGVFGARVSYQSAYFIGATLAVKGGTLGANAGDGTRDVNIRAVDVRVDALAFLRQRFDIGRGVALAPALVLGLDMSFQRLTTHVQTHDRTLFAILPGFGYGFSVGVEWRALLVTLQALLVSQDARTPALFTGLSFGYLSRL